MTKLVLRRCTAFCNTSMAVRAVDEAFGNTVQAEGAVWIHRSGRSQLRQSAKKSRTG